MQWRRVDHEPTLTDLTGPRHMRVCAVARLSHATRHNSLSRRHIDAGTQTSALNQRSSKHTHTFEERAESVCEEVEGKL
jgi:hypothetical protein